MPPRVLAPVTVEPDEPVTTGTEPPEPAPRKPARPRPRPDGAARPEEPASAEPGAKTDAPAEAPTSEKPAAAPEPNRVLQTPQTADDGEAARRIRDALTRARRDLAKVNAPTLGSDARTQYETARRFIDQAEDALTVKNYMFAQYLADKAEALARGLQGR